MFFEANEKRMLTEQDADFIEFRKDQKALQGVML